MAPFVDLTEFRHLNASAEHTLALFRRRLGFPNGPPVPVEMIGLALFGLRWEVRRLGHLGRHTVAALSVGGGIVYVDVGCSRHQFVFAVAHEIGHRVLHGGDHSASDVSHGRSQGPLLVHILGSGRAMTQERRARLREIEANRFAGALLIPRSMLFREAANYDTIDETAVRELAGRFQVSISAMVCRINDLSRHLAWEGPVINLDSAQRLSPAAAPRFQPDKEAGGPGAWTSPSANSTFCSTAAGNRQGRGSFGAKKKRAIGVLGSLVEFADRRFTCLGPRAHASSGGRAVVDYQSRPQRSRLAGAEQSRPVVIEFAGTSNSGKDTLIQILKDYLEDVHGYRVRVIDEGVKFCHIDKCLHDADLLYKTIALAVVQLYEASFENPGDYDFIIFNRGIFDRLAFVRTAQLCQVITREQARIHTQYLLSYAALQDILCLFFISPGECLRREREGKRSIVSRLAAERDMMGSLPQQRVLNEDMLTLLNSSYLYALGSHKESFNPCYVFNLADWGDASPLEESLLCKARGLADAILPRYSSQLRFPEMFGMCYVSDNSHRSGTTGPHEQAPESSRQLPSQLSLPWGGVFGVPPQS